MGVRILFVSFSFLFSRLTELHRLNFCRGVPLLGETAADDYNYLVEIA